MAIILVLLALGVLSPVSIRGDIEYNRSYEGLTSFPHDIPTDTTDIYLENNLIPAIDYVEPFPGVRRINLKYNAIAAFPNLVNVSLTLAYLTIGYNQVSYIEADYLDQLVNLKELYVQYNHLTSIPDVAGPSQRLRHLTLTGNYFEQFPSLSNLGKSIVNLYVRYQQNQVLFTSVDLRRLRELPKLEYLDLSEMPLNSWTDLCRVNGSSPLDLALKDTDYTCDSRMSMAKLAEGTGRVTFGNRNPACKNPQRLQGRDWADITIDDLLNKGDFVQAVYKLIDDMDSYFCYPALDETLENASFVECAAICTRKPECIMFAYKSGQCTTTTLAAGSESQFRSFGKWYILDTDP